MPFNIPTAVVVTSSSNWTVSASVEGYGPDLEVIQNPQYFMWLYDNRKNNGFTGAAYNPKPYSGNYPNAEAIQETFVKVGTTASSKIVKGLDKNSIRPVLTDAIQILTNADLTNYIGTGNKDIFLVNNYDPATKYADGIGAVSITWQLSIDGSDTHYMDLAIQARSVLYNDPEKLCADYNSVISQFKIDPSTTSD
jgi:hypothetical protein